MKPAVKNGLDAYPEPVSEKIPWFMFFFLAAGFFLIQHQWTPNVMIEGSFTPDEFARLISDGDVLRRVVIIAMGCAGAFLLIRKRQYLLRPEKLGWAVICYGAWSFLSILWADDPDFCFRRLMIFAMFSLTACGVAGHWSLDTLIRWVLFSTLMFLVVGIASELAHGTFAPFSAGYRFGGTLHPNSQGLNCGMLILSGITVARFQSRNCILLLAIAGAAFVFLVMTGSRTALAAAFIATMILITYVWSKRFSFAVLYAAVLGVCGMVVLGFSNTLIHAVLLGRSDSEFGTLTERIPIWMECLDLLEHNLLYGVGYGSFWSPRRFLEISRRVHFVVGGAAHSAYIEIMLGSGIIGLLLFLAVLFGSIGKSWVLFLRDRDERFVFALSILLLFTMDGILESIVIMSTQFFAILLTLFCMLGFQSRRHEVMDDVQTADQREPLYLQPSGNAENDHG